MDLINHETNVCSSCGQLISSSSEYCPICSVPTIVANNLDPFLSIENEGRLLSRAVDVPRKPIVLIGMWILFLPVFLFGMFFSISIITQGASSGTENFFFFWGAFGLAFAGFTVLSKTTANYFRPHPKVAEERRELSKALSQLLNVTGLDDRHGAVVFDDPKCAIRL
jgi:RNA polymerase subunit RPABC4/transcription elongation factor Spt4